MNFLITPIEIRSNEYCCVSPYGHTTGVLVYDAQELGFNRWRVYETELDDPPGEQATGPIKKGIVDVGFCCATGVNITVSGYTEVLNEGFDNLHIYINNVYQTGWESNDGGGAYEREYREYTLDLPLTPQPCGNIVTFSGTTVDNIAQSGVFWDAQINNIYP